MKNDRLILEEAIALQETLRGKVDGAIIEATISTLREKLASLTLKDEPQDVQRKQVTIFFVDIADSTKIIQHLDPEDAQEIIGNILHKMANPIEEHGGRIVRFLGDGFLAIFGVPSSSEDDPERAIRAGLIAMEITEQVGYELEKLWNIIDFNIHIGINTGLVAISGSGNDEYTLMGSAVHLASRIENFAQPGDLLISHDTYRHVRGIFDLEALEPVKLKGFDEPVSLYRVLRAKPRTFRVTSRGVEGVETRMVGREAELLYLQDAFQCMQEEREGSIITIVGEAGIGKSRLLYEFQNWLEFQKIDIRLFLGRALQEQQQTPFALLHDVFSFHCQIQESDPLETVHQKIESCFGEIIGTEKTSIVRSHFIGQLLGFDFTDSPHLTGLLENPQHLHERAIAYLNEYFQVLANQYPIVIFLEDIHWADDSSLDLINQISPLTSKNPLLIICLARPNLYQQRPNWGEGLDYHHKLELSALNKRESRSLVGEILKKVDQVPVALRELVVSWAEGNPFYIEELIKMLIENGVILTGAEHWRVIPDQLAQVNVPATLTGVLQARLDGLPDSEHVSLRLAAVVGRIFWEEAIYYMLEKLNSQETMVKGLELSAALTSLREHELIYRREGSTFAETNEYLFKHALLRDVAYENIPKRERRAYHKLTADWLRETTSSTNRSDEYSAQIAEHYYLANERDSAIEWLFRAGLRAKKQDAMREARSYLSRALDLMPVEDLDRRWQILLERDEILGIVGEQDARLAEDDELVRIAEATNDKNKVAEAYYRKGYFLYTLGQIPASMEACEEAIDAAIQAGNRKLEILATGIVIVNHKTLGEIEAATEKAEYVLGIADGHLDDHTFASTLGNLGMIYENLDIQKAIQLYERSIEISDRSGNHYFKAVGLLNIGYIYIMAGHADRGVKALKTALDLNESIGSPRTTIYNLLNLGLAYYHFGDYHAATESLKKAESAIKDREDPIAVAYCNNYLGLVAEQSLTASVARQFFQKAFELFNQIGSMGYAKDAAAGMARTALSMDNLAEAQAGAVEVWEYLSSKGPKGMEFPVLAFLTCAKIFQDAKDHDRMMAAINGGYDELNKRAGKFSDEDWRNTYLHAITEHAAMLEMWQQYHGEL